MEQLPSVYRWGNSTAVLLRSERKGLSQIGMQPEPGENQRLEIDENWTSMASCFKHNLRGLRRPVKGIGGETHSRAY